MNQLEFLQAVHSLQHKILNLDQKLDLAELTEEEKNMAVSQPVADLISKFDAATDAVAARIQRLIDKAPSLSADDTAALQAEVDKLAAMGKDVENPIPTPV